MFIKYVQLKINTNTPNVIRFNNNVQFIRQ